MDFTILLVKVKVRVTDPYYYRKGLFCNGKNRNKD